MKAPLRTLLFVFAGSLLMGTTCHKNDLPIPVAKQGFAEKIELSPAQKTYAVGDTIWLHFATPSKALFDTISQQRLSASALRFQFGAVLWPRYDTPTNPADGFCDFMFPNGITPVRRVSNQSGSSTSIMIGCDNSPTFDIKLGVVLKYKGYYTLEIPMTTAIEPCSGSQSSPYPYAGIRFTYNLTDPNKDVYLSIPAAARNEYPSGYTERQLEAKVAYALKVL